MKKILIVILVLTSACSVVSPKQRGVRVILGQVSEDTKAPGPYLWIPFIMSMSKLDITVQKSDIKSEAATKDMQDLHASVSVNWSLNPETVVNTYKTIGDEDIVLERILIPAVSEVMKAATAKLTAEEVLTKRLEMKEDIDKGLEKRLLQYGIKLYGVNIVNLQFSDGFRTAIEKKQIAEQQSKQAVYEAQKATQDANAAVEAAKGQAASQKLVRETLTPSILQQRAIEKWDGHFPQFMGNGQLPFINFTTK